MNSVERIVYDLIKGNPRLKFFVRNAYQNLFDLLPDKENFFASDKRIQEGYFFGFHDLSPFSYDEDKILANKLEIELHMPSKEDILTVGYWNSSLSSYTQIGKTTAWNYHKGCRLQWVGRKSNKIIYNSVNGDTLGSTIFDITTKTETHLDYPIDTVNCEGKTATSFSYERLQEYMPGYGYIHGDDPYFDEDDSDNTGLFLVNIENNTRKLIVSLKKLAYFQRHESMAGAKHYVTHSEFSPDGNRVSFLHRWIHNDTEKRFTRLITCNLEGEELYASPTTGMVSHYVWDKDHGILAYCQINGIDGHYIFCDHTMRDYKRAASQLNSDGHQSYIPNTEYFVTDTYPDKRRYAKIYLANISDDSVKKIIDVKSPKKYQSPNEYKHWACDLHPRVSPSGKWICFDTVYTGQRSLCIMDISGIK